MSGASSLPSTTTLSTPSMLSDDTESVPASLALATPPRDTTVVGVSQETPDYRPPRPRNMWSIYGRARRVAAAPFNPRGPFALFVPGELTLDSRVQYMYNNFLYDLPATGATGQLFLVTRGHRVGIFTSW